MGTGLMAEAGLAPSSANVDLEVRGERIWASDAVGASVGVLGLCPYSEETVAGCRHYRPVSAHGDFPGAGHCEEASVLNGVDHIRHTICRRRMESAAGFPVDRQNP
jgi:hypothetical protein